MMTTSPTWSPVDDDTHDLLTLVATGPLFGDSAEQRFLIACWTDARDHDGRVSVNRVRALLSNEHGLQIDPRRLSGLWSVHTGPGRAMAYSGELEQIAGDASRNAGKPVRIRAWRTT